MTTKATINIELTEQIATINPNIYGHFAEHLGHCIYEGIWVGEDSTIPNTDGIRDDVVAALKRIKPPVVRWPGGCFADDYHWEDGVGPRAQRPKRINAHWGQVIEPNEFGTHEFIEFCRRISAEPYICGNVGSGSPKELRDWVEYCNFPGDSTLALQRANNGAVHEVTAERSEAIHEVIAERSEHKEPFRVKYWGVGNENWGCGGNFDAEDYAAEYRRFATFLFNFADPPAPHTSRQAGAPLYLIACGPSGNNHNWTHKFFQKLRGRRIHGYAAHYYCGTAGTATEYTTDQWYELLHRASQMEKLVVEQREIMDEYDPQRRIGLIVDEWGTWHPATPGRKPSFLWQQNTLRDALVAALTLDIFNRHADKVVMGNIAQTINVLQAMILTEGDKMLTTPTFHVYEMYSQHQGGQSLKVSFNADEISFSVGNEERKFWGLNGSASLTGKTVCLTVVNPHVENPIEATIHLSDGEVKEATARVLTHDDIHAHNTFDAPQNVTPCTESLSVTGKTLQHCFPPASVTALLMQLA